MDTNPGRSTRPRSSGSAHPMPSSYGRHPLWTGARAAAGALLLVLTMTAVAAAANASGTTSAEAPHVLVGTWIAVNDLDPSAAASDVLIHPDGTATLFTADGPYAGVWQATDGASAEATFVSTVQGGTATYRVAVTVAADGDTFSGSYTFESTCGCGDTTGQLGPGSVSGTRVTLDPMGEPVAPLPTPEPGPSPSAGAGAAPSPAASEEP